MALLGAIPTKLWTWHTGATSEVSWGSGTGRYGVSSAGGRYVRGGVGIIEICGGGAERLTVFIRWIKIAGAGERIATLKTSMRKIGIGSIVICCRDGSEVTKRSLRMFPSPRHSRYG